LRNKHKLDVWENQLRAPLWYTRLSAIGHARVDLTLDRYKLIDLIFDTDEDIRLATAELLPIEFVPLMFAMELHRVIWSACDENVLSELKMRMQTEDIIKP
jgi:hypothetical protein